MFRCWLIRGSLLFLLAASVAGWGVSTCRRVRCGYYHDHKLVACNTTYGAVEFSWSQNFFSPGGWHLWYEPQRFGVVDADFLLKFESTTYPGDRFFKAALAGFYYEHTRMERVSGTPLEHREVRIPFWFPILVTALVLWWAWRKTRSRLDTRTAFPVEIRGTSEPRA